GRFLVAALEAQGAALGEEASRDSLEVARVPDRALGEELQALPHGARALLEQPAHHHAGARGHRWAAVGHQAGVGGLDRREVGRHAERLRHQLRGHGGGPLPALGAGRKDPRPAVVREIERRDRAELDLAAAGEAGAVIGEREPDAAAQPPPVRPRPRAVAARLAAPAPGRRAAEARPTLARLTGPVLALVARPPLGPARAS